MEAWRPGVESSNPVEETLEGNRRHDSRKRKWRAARASSAPEGAHEALPHTPPGDKPPETPGPLSLRFEVPDREAFVKGSQAAQKQRALDKCLPIRKTNWDEGKGASVHGALLRLPLVGPKRVLEFERMKFST